MIQLQNLLNLLLHDSILFHSSKTTNPQEKQRIIDKHPSLPVDGIFGENTEQCVIKFQKYKELKQDGVVTEHIWSMMLAHAENLSSEGKRGEAKVKD